VIFCVFIQGCGFENPSPETSLSHYKKIQMLALKLGEKINHST